MDEDGRLGTDKRASRQLRRSLTRCRLTGTSWGRSHSRSQFHGVAGIGPSKYGGM